jgi:hypothetical protein
MLNSKIEHEVAPPLFQALKGSRMIESGKNPRRATIHPHFFAYIDHETDQLRFMTKNQRIVWHAVPSMLGFMIRRLDLFNVEYKNGQPQYTYLWKQHDQVHRSAA